MSCPNTNTNTNDITTPLLPSDHLILTVDPPTTTAAAVNPFKFLGSDDDDEEEEEELTVPPPLTVDPFKNNTPQIEGCYEWLKMLLCLPIAILRLVLFGVCLGVGYVATRLALEGWKDKENPMPKWRCRLMWVTRICARWILFSFGYQWIQRKGRPAPREVAPIIVSNHVSYIEPIFYFYELFPTIVAAESHDSIPFVGTIIRAMQVIYVDRFSPSSRKRAVKEIKDLNNRKGLLAIDFLEYYYFLREPRLMAGTLSPSNLVHLSLGTQSSL